jgi:starch synthase
VKVAVFTREYPPAVYGGAGVHVEYLVRELSRLEDVTVHAWGVGDVPHEAWDVLAGSEPHLAALRALSIDLSMTARAHGTDIVHTQARLRRPPRCHRALARAAATVEGRAARRRLRALLLG